jgi:cyanophycinase
MAVPLEAYQERDIGMRIPIGGGGGRRIFSQIVGEMQPGTDLAIVTVSSRQEYSSFIYNRDMFKGRRVGFGGEIYHVNSQMSPEAARRTLLENNLGGIYLGGGDQGLGLEVMQRLQIADLIVDLNKRGVVVAGTSAGASEIAEVMPVDEKEAPGLNIINGVIIDQHFADRTRFDRLVTLVEKKQLVGIGLDENTGITVDPEGKAKVIGNGNAYIFRPTNGKWHEPIRKNKDGEIDLKEMILYTIYEADHHAPQIAA